MSEEIDFVYNTRARGKRFSKELQTRLSLALSSDLESVRDVDELDEIDIYADFDDDQDVDYIPEEDASDIEDELVIEPNELISTSDSEEEEEEETRERPKERSDEYFYGKDNTEWKKNEPSVVGRKRHHNIMRFRSGPRISNSIPLEVFKLFFTPNMSFIIVSETNRYANETVQKWNVENPKQTPRVWKELTSTELDAFIGILLAAGVSHNNMQKSEVQMLYPYFEQLCPINDSLHCLDISVLITDAHANFDRKPIRRHRFVTYGTL